MDSKIEMEMRIAMRRIRHDALMSQMKELRRKGEGYAWLLNQLDETTQKMADALGVEL